MPQVGKEALSQFIRTECLRLLRLNLSPDAQAFQQERTAAGMPPVQPPVLALNTWPRPVRNGRRRRSRTSRTPSAPPLSSATATRIRRARNDFGRSNLSIT